MSIENKFYVLWLLMIAAIVLLFWQVCVVHGALDLYSFSLNDRQPTYMEVMQNHPILALSYIDSFQGEAISSKLLQLDSNKTWVILVYSIDPQELA